MIALMFAWLAVAQETVAIDLVVQVTQPTDAGDALVAKAQEVGGWFQSRTQTEVALRVPSARAEGVLAYATTLGKVADRSVQRGDLTRDLAELTGRVQAREEVLERYYAVLDAAGPQSIVAVERQIVSAIEQIESLKGQIRVLEDQVRWARVNVSFRYRDRAAPRRDGASSFAWLNTLNVQDLLDGMRAWQPDWTTRGVGAVTPEGFSAWRKPSRFRAASPDGVLYRVRTVKHEPRADLAFWTEAVRERMVAAGYTRLAEGALEANGAEGGLIELAAPVGDEDWTYLIGFFPAGKRMILAEAAGEARALDAHRDAILKAMGG